MSEHARVTEAISKADRRHILLVFAGLMVAMLLASLDQMIFSTALPTIVGDLNGVDHMLWVTTAYILASTIMLPVYGKLGDQIGRKGLFIFAIGVFIAGSLIGGLAGDMTWLIIGRTVQGLGGGGLMILAQAIIADVVPARQRGKYMGIMGAVFALSTVAGPLLGGWFTEGIGWRWAFWMNIPLGVLAIASALFFLRLPKPVKRKIEVDYAGMALIGIASTCLVLATSWAGSTYEWTSPVIIGLIIASLVAGFSFFAVERRAAEPIMPTQLFGKRNFNLTTAAGLITGIAMFGAMAYMPTYLQMVTGANATQSGLLMVPMMIGMLATSIGSGQLVSRTGRYKWLPITGTAIVAFSLYLLSTMSPDTPIPVLCGYLTVMGIGLGMGMQLLVLIVQDTFPAAMVGTATAANNYFRQIGAALGSAIVGSLFVSRLTDALASPLPASDGAGSTNSFTPALVQALPPEVQGIIVNAYNDALTPIFLFLVPVVVIAVLLLCFVHEKPLSTTIEREILPESLEIDGRSSVLLEGPDDADDQVDTHRTGAHT